MMLIISIISSPVYAENDSIIFLNDVVPLKVDSGYKKAKLIQENGKIFKRKIIKEEVVTPIAKKILTNNTSKTASIPVPEKVNLVADNQTSNKITEKETVKPSDETKKPDEVTIIPENGKSTETKSAEQPTPTAPEPIKSDNTKLNVEQVKELIAKYSQKYNVDVDTMLRIANCESKFQPNIIGSGKYFGVFQFSKSTFNESVPTLNFQDPDPLNPDQNIEMAAYLISEGQAWRWGCK